MTGEEAKAESEYGMDSYNKYNDSYNVEKIECSNINININTEDNDLFSLTPNDNNGQQLSANAFGNNEGNNGFKQNDEDVLVKCIQNNNNGSQEPLTCEECFEVALNDDELSVLLAFIERVGIIGLTNLCERFDDSIPESDIREALEVTVGLNQERIDRLIECLFDAGVVFEPED